jgi:hypothetical protein
MGERDGVRPEHASGVPSTASTATPQAPDEPVGRFETANDPTGGSTWIRRRFRLPQADGAEDALDAVLVVPGVARAALDPGSRDLVADIEPGVVSDDELNAAIGRGGIEPEGWSDEPIPAGEWDAEGARRAGGPVSDDERSDLVEEQSEESFPASDPPSSWAGSDDA